MRLTETNYNLVDVAEMGIADYIRNPKMSVPKWMNETEVRAYKVGFERAKDQCKQPRTVKYK